MRRALLLVSALALMCLALPAQAQISITADDLRTAVATPGRLVNRIYEADNPAALQAAADATGGNQTFNFTGTSYTEVSDDTTLFELATPPVPGSDDPHFSTATHIIRSSLDEELTEDSTAYIYARLTDDALRLLGFAAVTDLDDDGEEDEVLLKYTPGKLLYELPLTFGSSWHDSTEQVMSFGGFDLTVTEVDDVTVEAWGTLVTPAGSAPAIKVRTRTISHTDLGIPGFPAMVDTSYSISFLTKSTLLEAPADLELDSNGQVTYGYYTVGARIGGGVANEPDGERPTRMRLDQNYPNPFNPETVIPFEVTESGHATLRIYNALGQEVAVLSDGFLPAGEHRISWRAEGLPSGVYLYRLTAAGQTQSRTLLLQK